MTKIDWGASVELGPGLRKSFPVLADAVYSLGRRRLVEPIVGGILCILLLCVYFC